MVQLPQTVQCPIAGLETVQVTFDLMAPPAKADNFLRRMAGGKSHEDIVLDVTGWPKEYGDDPWDEKRAPGVWFAWVSRRGWAQAMTAYLNDPNS